MCLPGNGTFAGTRELDRGYGMEGLYKEDMPMVWECVYVFERLIKIYIPRLSTHLDEQEVIAGTYAPQYFITVFLVLSVVTLSFSDIFAYIILKFSFYLPI
jgi:hypothetical protein